MDDPFSMSPEDLEKRALVYKTREKYVMDHLQELVDLFSESRIEETIGTLKQADQLLLEASDRRTEEIQAKRKKEKE